MSEFDDIREDAHEVFCFSHDKRPQERAHEYLARNMVARGCNDTAMERVVYDLIDRAYEAGYEAATNRDGCAAGCLAIADIEATIQRHVTRMA